MQNSVAPRRVDASYATLEARVIDVVSFSNGTFHMPVEVTAAKLPRHGYPDIDANSELNTEYLKATQVLCFGGAALPIFPGDRIRAYTTDGIYAEPATRQRDVNIVELLDDAGNLRASYGLHYK